MLIDDYAKYRYISRTDNLVVLSSIKLELADTLINHCARLAMCKHAGSLIIIHEISLHKLRQYTCCDAMTVKEKFQ